MAFFVGMYIFYLEPTFAISSLKTYIRTNSLDLTTNYPSKKQRKRQFSPIFKKSHSVTLPAVFVLRKNDVTENTSLVYLKKGIEIKRNRIFSVGPGHFGLKPFRPGTPPVPLIAGFSIGKN